MGIVKSIISEIVDRAKAGQPISETDRKFVAGWLSCNSENKGPKMVLPGYYVLLQDIQEQFPQEWNENWVDEKIEPGKYTRPDGTFFCSVHDDGGTCCNKQCGPCADGYGMNERSNWRL